MPKLFRLFETILNGHAPQILGITCTAQVMPKLCGMWQRKFLTNMPTQSFFQLGQLGFARNAGLF